MTDISPLLPALPRELDGFRVEIDPAHERGDIVLDRPPLNVITMVEREQLRWASRSSTQILGCASSCSEQWAGISAFWRDRRFSRSIPGARLASRLEHRCTGALFQADCCRQSRLLFRGRLRTLVGL